MIKQTHSKIGLLNQISIPLLKKIHTGKVRDSFRLNHNQRLIVTTDRVSAFDHKLKTLIFHKGAILNSLSSFWFEKTKEIVDNHFIRQVDPNIMIVQEVRPILLEVIVRDYLTGSLWRSYKNDGRRSFDFHTLPDGMAHFQQISKITQRPLITFTTKGVKDEEISEKEIMALGMATPKELTQIRDMAIKLFLFGQTILKRKGLILADTKYEFGVDQNNNLVLIDELHTPDSSRIWSQEIYESNRGSVEEFSYDKDYLRNLLKIYSNEAEIPPHHFEELSSRYLDAYFKIVGTDLREQIPTIHIRNRIYDNLQNHLDQIPIGMVAIVMGHKSDLEYAQKIKKVVEDYGIYAEFRVTSAHKNGEEVLNMASEYNNMIGPVCIIAVAGKSNALGGALAMNMNHPIINCPYFSDKLDLMLNINSSLIMPSKTPIATTIDPESAALMALRTLQIPALKERFIDEVYLIKRELQIQDQEVRGR